MLIGFAVKIQKQSQTISAPEKVVKINNKISQDDIFSNKRPFPKHFATIICTQDI